MQARVAHDHGAQRFGLVVGEVVLAQGADAQLRTDGHLARLRLDRTGQHLQERRLARAIRSDQPVAIAGGELDVDVFKQDSAAEAE
jgi:hypothetical protein